MFRAVAARAMYLSLDRPDIMFSAKELCREFAAPTCHRVVKLKRLVRYLKGRPRMQLVFQFQEMPDALTTFTDSDWAGCPYSRRSTSGGIVMLGRRLLKCWSRTQATVALPSAGAELYAAIK